MQQKTQQATNVSNKDDEARGEFVGENEKSSARPEQAEKDIEDKESDSIEEKQDDKEAQLAELQEKYLRLSAEFDNYRKRTLKERIDLTKSAGENILVNLLPVMDDFDRAMSLMEIASDCKAMKEGIDLIYSKMKDFLKHNGIKEIDAIDKDFDTDLHEAVTKIPAADKKKRGKVVDVIQKGYYLNDKIIRYSKVVVGE
ncbi:MAG: nucleotide exchange factor GrpE [Bacteroidales bacterium]|nr:nucleotide exchange factor GrpE [Bacteroidales bacterium]